MSITAGTRATLIIENGLGLTIAREVTMNATPERKPTYQGSVKNNVVLLYTLKGMRKKLGYAIGKVAIVDGWGHDLEADNGSIDADGCKVTIIGNFNSKTFDNTLAAAIEKGAEVLLNFDSKTDDKTKELFA